MNSTLPYLVIQSQLFDMKEQDSHCTHKIYHVLQSILLLMVTDSAPTINTVALSSTQNPLCDYMLQTSYYNMHLLYEYVMNYITNSSVIVWLVMRI